MMGFRTRYAWLGLGCLIALAACNNRSDSFIARSFPIVLNELFSETEDPKPQKVITRAELNQIPFATISLSAPDNEERRTFIVAFANNNGYVTYQEASGRSLVLFGGFLPRPMAWARISQL